MPYKAKLENLAVQTGSIRVVTAKVSAEPVVGVRRCYSDRRIGEHHVDRIAVRGEDPVYEVEIDN